MISLNGFDIEPTIFPDNTSQVWKLPEEALKHSRYHVTFEFSNEAEIMHLVQLVDLIKHTCVPRGSLLTMPYLPYARQDKMYSNTETFALRSFIKIINMLNFDQVNCIDIHSDVGKLINNLNNIIPYNTIETIAKEAGCNAFAFPDKGATDRYKELHNAENITGFKIRDQLTGHITEYTMKGEPKGKNILIVDDICDGGMTFKLLAKSLLEKGAESVNLYVSHGIFSKGVKTIKDSGISRIFTHKGEIFPSRQTNFLIKEFN